MDAKQIDNAIETLKHGSHNQLTHGRSGGGASIPVSTRAQAGERLTTAGYAQNPRDKNEYRREFHPSHMPNQSVKPGHNPRRFMSIAIGGKDGALEYFTKSPSGYVRRHSDLNAAIESMNHWTEPAK